MPPQVILEMSVTLPAPPEAVWPRLVDWEHLGDWMREASDFTVTSPQREGLGVTCTARIRIAGITTHDAIVVRRWEPPAWFVIEHLGWVKGRGTMHCRPVDGGTYLWWQEALRPPLGWLGWIGMEALKPVLGRTFRRDLHLLHELVETQAGR